MTLGRNQILGVFVVIILVAGVVFVWQNTGEEDTATEREPDIVKTVERQTLRDELTINGELRRDELSTINSPFDGRVSQLSVDDGDTINAGDVLLSLDGRAAVAANGDFSFYRQLDVGSDGPDVLQLERILVESGYDPGTVDRLYTEATRSALRNWQIRYGYGGATPEPEETIVIALAEGNGYTIADKDTTALIIGPSVPPQPEDGGIVFTAGGGAGFTPLQVDPLLPRIGMDVASASVTEGGTYNVVLQSTPAPTSDTEIEVTFEATATGGDQDDVDDPDIDVDYFNEPLEDIPFIWPAGETTVSLTLRTLADDLDEDDEEWSMTLVAEQILTGANYDIGPIKTMTVDILDDNDPKVPTLTLSVDEDDEMVDEGGAATFTVESDIELDAALEVRYEVIGGSALEVDDYDEQDERATFDYGANDDIDTFTVATVQDDDIEADETITIRLLPADDPDELYVLADPNKTATVTIEDDDLPELTMITRERTVPEGSVVEVVIEADQGPKEDISVDYTIDGTATMGVDFNTLTGSITFPQGRTRIAIVVKTTDDDVIFVPSDMIVAEWPARIGTVFVDEGETVQLGHELLTLTEPVFTIRLFANPTDRSELSLGQVVTVEIEAGDQTSTGRITQLDDAATISDSGAESYEGVVEIEDELLAVDGANVRIEVILDERVDAIVVPIAAISQDGTGNDVVTIIDVDNGNQYAIRQIVTGLQEGSFTEVVSGLSGGELVVVETDN